MSFSQSAAEAEASTRALLAKAATARAREPQGALRKDALKRLTALSKSPFGSVKRLVAENLRYFFRDFPGLEDEVINAVYDICEDGEQSVRIAGYRAIVELSREDGKWTKRNTDVLLQLLQSDDAVELDVITTALLDHIHIDAAAALSVMCDHAAADLRALVLDFFLRSAREPILAAVRGSPSSEPQAVFRDGLLRVLPKSTPLEAAQIADTLLLPLDSFAPGQPYRAQLLDALLEHCKIALKSDLRAKNPLTLPTTLPLLECASRVPGVPLIRFNATFLLTRNTLMRLSPDVQLKVLSYYFTALSDPNVPASERDDALDNSGFIIETLARASGPDMWTVVHQLANAFITRGTACPPPLVPAWRMLQQQAESEPRHTAGDALRQIKLVLDPPPVPVRPAPSGALKRKASESAAAPVPRGPGGLFRQAMLDAVPGADHPLAKRMRPDSSASPAVREKTPPQPLVARIDRAGSRSAPPSLLNRMLASTPVSPAAGNAAARPSVSVSGRGRAGASASVSARGNGTPKNLSLSARISGGPGQRGGRSGGVGAPSLLQRMGSDGMDVDVAVENGHRPLTARRMRVYNTR